MKIWLNIAGCIAWIVLMLVGAAPVWVCAVMMGLCAAGVVHYALGESPETEKLNYVSLTAQGVHLPVWNRRVRPPGPGSTTPVDPDNECEYGMMWFSYLPNSPHYDAYSLGILRKVSIP